MKKIIFFLSAMLLVQSGFTQPVGTTITDSVSLKVIHYLQTRQPDSIYALVGQKFKERLTQENFRNITLNQLLPFNDFSNVVFVRSTDGINKYRVAGNPEFQLLIGLDKDNKIETLLFQPYKDDVQDDAVPSFITDSLDVYVNRALIQWQVPGVAVCVVKNGKVVVMKGYGVTELGSSHKVDENTLFMIGSNTKAFTATALAMLGDEKKLSLDDKVTKWLPQFRLQNKAAGEQAIIRDLLCHRLGMSGWQGNFMDYMSNLTRGQIIEKMGLIKAPYPFRTTYGYNNAAFVAAGQIIPDVTGRQWEDFIREKLFVPLGMSHTLALCREYPLANNKCEPHTLVQDKLEKISYYISDQMGPAATISSSVNDMSKWIIMQLSNGMYNGNQVVPAGAIAQTRLPHSIIGNGGTLFNRGHFSLYGLGWYLEEYESRKIVSHAGDVDGFLTGVTLLPEERLGILVFTNTDANSFFEALKWEIIDAYLKLPYRNYSSTFLKYYTIAQNERLRKDKELKDSVAMHLPAALALGAYTGDYTNDRYGDMKVALEAGELRMNFSHHPDMYAKLESLGGNRFYAVFSNPELRSAVFPFTVVDKKVKSVTVKVEALYDPDLYEFVKKTAK